MSQTVLTKNKLALEAKLIQVYPNGKLFFLQDRIIVTDKNNLEIDNIDIIHLIEKIQ